MLDDLEDLGWMLRKEFVQIYQGHAILDGMYCPECDGDRRMHVGLVYQANGAGTNVLAHASNIEAIRAELNKAAPILFVYVCVQCEAIFNVLIYSKADGPELAIFPEGRGSLATPNTPGPVRYYLDQVQRCWSVGANSAAISMYRVALDHLLFGEGFEKGMVGAKLGNLQKAIEEGTAPGWAANIDPRYMEVLNSLATYALHPNDGKVDQQAVFDRKLLVAVKATFQALLIQVYELPHQEQDRLNTLESALESLRTADTSVNPAE